MPNITEATRIRAATLATTSCEQTREADQHRTFLGSVNNLYSPAASQYPVAAKRVSLRKGFTKQKEKALRLP